MTRVFTGICLLATLAAAVGKLPAGGTAESRLPESKTRNILFVMTDGLRWREVFTGADESLLNKERGGVEDVEAIRRRFWRDSTEERRSVLLPFLWTTIAREGQILGNRLRGSTMRVANGRNFSYPGYSEALCGYPDRWVFTNAKLYNPNVSVFEWLSHKDGFRGNVAAFASWDVFPYILHAKRSGIVVNSGYMPLIGVQETEEVGTFNATMETPRSVEDRTRPDELTFQAALTYFKERKPRVLFLSFDETDAFGHKGRYDRLLESAHQFDAWVEQLWRMAQAMPEYRGTTSLVLATDHGRGSGPVDWRGHASDIDGSDATWAAFLGPDTPALGERVGTGPLEQGQIAATTAALLGYNYAADVQRAAAPMDGVIRNDR